MTAIQLDYDAWLEQFKPIAKPGIGHIAFDAHDDTDFLRNPPTRKFGR